MFQPDLTTLEEHPAVRAWLRLEGGRVLPRSVEVLVREGGDPRTRARIYRLNGVGERGTAVIAKWSRREDKRVERLIYEEILGALPLSALRCYGFVEDGTENASWTFLEDAGGVPYSEERAADRALAAEWLAVLHTATSILDLESRLPRIGPDRYLAYLEQSRRDILENMGNPALDAGAIAVLRKIVGHCDVIESRWDELERSCLKIPPCLVHFDFLDKNVRIRTGANGERTMFVMDWETAGWGVAAADVAGLDMEIYGPRVRGCWPNVSQAAVEEFELIGRIFQALGLVADTAPGLAYEWVEDPVGDLKMYEPRLAAAVGAFVGRTEVGAHER